MLEIEMCPRIKPLRLKWLLNSELANAQAQETSINWTRKSGTSTFIPKSDLLSKLLKQVEWCPKTGPFNHSSVKIPGQIWYSDIHCICKMSSVFLFWYKMLLGRLSNLKIKIQIFWLRLQLYFTISCPLKLLSQVFGSCRHRPPTYSHFLSTQ